MKQTNLYKTLGIMIFPPGLLLVLISNITAYYAFGFIMMCVSGFFLLKGNPKIE